MIENATLGAIEAELRRLDQEACGPGEQMLRTRVLTHIAWVPQQWEEAARAVLAGLDDRHPSRGILLIPDPESDRDALDAEIEVHRFAGGGVDRAVAFEVISIWLRGRRARAPASVVQPLLVSDLPAFLRWRGDLPFGATELEQLVGVAERMIVDGREWDDPEASYTALPQLFERIALSDIAWDRLLPWRRAIAALWPGVGDARAVSVSGPRAEALLLAGWLAGRLDRNVVLEHETKEEIERVEVNGTEVRPARGEHQSPDALLSMELDLFGRDAIYEEAVWSCTSRTSS